jgi:hypothetical protein
MSIVLPKAALHDWRYVAQGRLGTTQRIRMQNTTTETHASRCLCGAVRDEVVGRPRTTILCHCEYCQERTVSIKTLLVYFGREAVTRLSGPLENYRQVSDKSGRWIDSEFCQNCGSAVTWTLELVSGWRGFEAETFDNNADFPYDTHMWTDSAHPSDCIRETDTCFPERLAFTTEQLEQL